jgi:hypothetical protein
MTKIDIAALEAAFNAGGNKTAHGPTTGEQR